MDERGPIVWHLFRPALDSARPATSFREEMASESPASILQPHLRSIRVPCAGDKVFKDECVFSFDTPVKTCSPLPRIPNAIFGFVSYRNHRVLARPTSNAIFFPSFLLPCHMRNSKLNVTFGNNWNSHILRFFAHTVDSVREEIFTPYV